MGRFMSPDPSGLTYADPANPQSFNLYSYGLNNPLTNIDPTGVSCITLTHDDGTTEKGDDGDGQGCASAGIAGDQTVDTNKRDTVSVKPPSTGSDLEYDTRVAADEQWLTASQRQSAPTSAMYLQAIAETTGKLPNVCGFGVAGYIGASRLGVGGSLGTSNGLQFAAGVNLGHPGTGTTSAYGPGYTLAGGANGNISYTVPIPDTPFSASVGTRNGNPDAIQSVSVNSRVGKFINLSAYANTGTFQQCK